VVDLGWDLLMTQGPLTTFGCGKAMNKVWLRGQDVFD